MLKLFVLRLLVFFLSFFILLKLPGIFDSNADNDQSRDVNSIKCCKKIDSLDLLFLGSSYTYSALNPIFFDSLGFSSYNLGISGTGVYFIELVLEDYFNSKKIKPKYLIFDISHFAFCDKSDDFLSYPLHRYLNKPLSHEELIIKYPAHANTYLQLLANSSKKGISSFFKRINSNVDSTCYYRGFFQDYTMIDEKIEREDSLKFEFLKTAKFEEKKLDKLLELAEKYAEKGCKFFWFEAPTQNLKYFFNEKYRSDYELATNKLRSNDFLTELTVNDIKFNRSDYRNTDHLNSYGAQKISSEISQKLKLFLAKETK